MGIYCETYKGQCTAKICSEGGCSRALETRRRAEEQRGVILDREGNVIIQRPNRPAGEYSEAKQVPTLAFDRPVVPTQSRNQRRIQYLIGALAVGGVCMYLVASLGVVEAIQSVFRKPVAPVAVATPAAPSSPVAQPPAPKPAAVAYPSEIALQPLSDAPTPARFSPTSADELARRDETASGQLKNKGNVYVKTGNVELARQYYKAAIEEDEFYFEGYNNLANTYTDTGEPQKAEPYYKRGLMIVPESDVIRFNLGNSLLKAGRIEEATREFERVVYYSPTDVEAKLLLGVCYHHQNRLIEAAGQFQAILMINRDHAEANWNLSLIMSKLGRNALANAYRREALRVKPELANR